MNKKRKFYSIYSAGEIKGLGKSWYFYSADGKKISLADIEADNIYFWNEVSIPTEFLRYAGNSKPRFHFLKHGFYQTTFIPAEGKPSDTYIYQYRALIDERRLSIAKWIVEGEIYAAYHALREDYDKDLYLSKLENVQNVESVRAVEGDAMKAFWQYYENTISDFIGRRYNPPPDRYNALISFAYSHLYGSAFTAIKIGGLDPRIGYLHENRFRTYTLHLDIADLYKPYVAQFAMDLITSRRIKRRWFSSISSITLLSERGRREFLKYWDDFLRVKKNMPCGRYSLLITMVKDVYSLRNFLMSRSSVWKRCFVGGE